MGKPHEGTTASTLQVSNASSWIMLRNVVVTVASFALAVGCGGALVVDDSQDMPSGSGSGSGSRSGSGSGSSSPKTPLSPSPTPDPLPGGSTGDGVKQPPAALCASNKPFVVEDLGIEGETPSVTSDELTLVYTKDGAAAYESKRLPGQAFGPGKAFGSEWWMDVAISGDGLSLDATYSDKVRIEGTAGFYTRATLSTPFAMAGTGVTPPYPSPHLPVWRHVTLSNATTYYTDAWSESLHVVRNGVHSIELAKAMRWFAVTQNERLVHYSWYDESNQRRDVRALVAHRATPNDPFGAPTDITAELTPGPDWTPLYVSWVSNDDCVIYGFSFKYVWNNGQPYNIKHLFRAERK